MQSSLCTCLLVYMRRFFPLICSPNSEKNNKMQGSWRSGSSHGFSMTLTLKGRNCDHLQIEYIHSDAPLPTKHGLFDQKKKILAWAEQALKTSVSLWLRLGTARSLVIGQLLHASSDDAYSSANTFLKKRENNSL